MTKLNEVSLMDLLPPNLTRDAGVAAAAAALDEEFRKVLGLVSDLSYFSRLDNLSSEEADELAWQFHVDFYDPNMPLDTKRALVKNSFAWHRRKGTPSAVEELISTVFGDGEIEEWYEFGGDPGTFRVITSNADATDTQAEQFMAALDTIKRASAHLDAIQVSVADDMPVYFGFAVHTGSYLTVEQVM